MNIFALDKNPKIASLYHVDRHIVKMPLETAQMLCTTINLSGGEARYKTCFVNHPCTKWARESIENYFWLCELGIYLCEEYQHRYSKQHKCEIVIYECLASAPKLESKGLTNHALAMPEDCKTNDFVGSYINYYNKYKTHLFSWSKRDKPYFINK
jgi:hypothetical protein